MSATAAAAVVRIFGTVGRKMAVHMIHHHPRRWTIYYFKAMGKKERQHSIRSKKWLCFIVERTNCLFPFREKKFAFQL